MGETARDGRAARSRVVLARAPFEASAARRALIAVSVLRRNRSRGTGGGPPPSNSDLDALLDRVARLKGPPNPREESEPPPDHPEVGKPVVIGGTFSNGEQGLPRGLVPHRTSRSGGGTAGEPNPIGANARRLQFPRHPESSSEPPGSPGSSQSPRGNGRFLVGRSAPGQPKGFVFRAGRRRVRELKVRCSNQLSYSPTTILPALQNRATGLQNGRKPLESRRNSAHVEPGGCPSKPHRIAQPRQRRLGDRGD